jgi:hypothetical protein
MGITEFISLDSVTEETLLNTDKQQKKKKKKKAGE